MGATRFLIPVLTALLASVDSTASTLPKPKDASVDVNEQTFATGGDIKAWAAKSFFGGSRTYEFSRGGNDLVIVNGRPTSGMVTSYVMVYGRAQGEPTFRQLLTTGVMYARIQAKEDAPGVVLSVDDKVVLIVPFELATLKSKPISVFERPR